MAFIVRLCCGLLVRRDMLLCLTDRSAYLIAAYRPRCPVLAVTRDMEVARQMQLYRGLIPIHFREPRMDNWTEDMDSRIYLAIDMAWERHVSCR